jgi:hypothetical protein
VSNGELDNRAGAVVVSGCRDLTTVLKAIGLDRRVAAVEAQLKAAKEASK